MSEDDNELFFGLLERIKRIGIRRKEEIDLLRLKVDELEEENERLRHHEAWTIGLWATDRPELFNTTVYVEDDEGLPKKVSMFEITRTPSNKEVQS